MRFRVLSRAVVCCLLMATRVLAQGAPEAQEEQSQEPEAAAVIEEITVVGRRVSYQNNQTTEAMLQQESSLTSPLAVIDNLPGVLVNEGDSFGSDDWSTTVTIRGFQLSLDEQQLGITVDGMANGNSNYGGGAKANRYIDTENLRAVEVSQGTADIASRSNEALGGTLNFTTIDPGMERRWVTRITAGSHEGRKVYVRHETGEFLPQTYAWVSASASGSTDWINQAAENSRRHLAAKFIRSRNGVDWSGYFSLDDVEEDNYQRISLEQFRANPEWDRLTAEWTGLPWVDQLYRKGWSTLRDNAFAYLKAAFALGAVDFEASVYFHKNIGRGDWVPPYVVDVHADGGNPESELNPDEPVLGGEPLGRLYFVDADGRALAPLAGCESSIRFPYGGAGPEYDPACYPAGAIPVGSYRHTHYEKKRLGFNLDFHREGTLAQASQVLRGGLWLEDYLRKEARDWHRISDSRLGYAYEDLPYWVQYRREYPVTTAMFYLDQRIEWGDFTAHAGVKQFLVDLERRDTFTGNSVSVHSDSDPLFSAGLVYRTPLDGLDLFAGYARNFAAIKDEVLERDASTLEDIAPETADNLDLGLRYVSHRLQASLTGYRIDFSNRLTFIAPDSPAGIDYLIGTNGRYVNTGGIRSRGLESALTWRMNEHWQLYASWTRNRSTYGGGSVDFPAGNVVFGSAERMAVLSLSWNHARYFAGISGKWVGERWLDAANTRRIPAYLLTDLYAGLRLDAWQSVEDLELKLTVNNAFDVRYLGGVAGQAAWLGAARTAALSLQFSF